MEAKEYWLGFISGLIDRMYLKKDMDANQPFAYNDGIRFVIIKEMSEVLYQKTINELVK